MLVTVLASSLGACADAERGPRNEDPAAESRIPAAPPAGGDTTIALRIGGSGQTLELPGFAAASFPAGAIRPERTVRLSATASPATARDFEITAEMDMGVTRIVPREIRLNTGAAAPSRAVRLTISVRGRPGTDRAPNAAPAAYVQHWQDGGQEILDQFEPARSHYDPDLRVLAVELLPGAFTNRRRSDGTYEAVVVVGSRAHPGPDED